MVIYALKIAWRNLARHRISNVINVLGLCLGLSICLVVYLITRFELSYDTFHQDRDKIFRVVGELHSTVIGNHKIGSVPDPAAEAMRNEMTGFQSVAMFHNLFARVTIRQADKQTIYEALKRDEAAPDIIITEPSYFDIFPYQWLAGNRTTALNDPGKVVLTKSKARKYFGNLSADQIIGRELIYMDSLRLAVSGIVEDLPENSDLRFNDFISFSTVPGSFLRDQFRFEQWGNFRDDNQVFVKLAPGTTPSNINKQFEKFTAAHIPPSPTDKIWLKLQPLSKLHFDSNFKDLYARKVHLPTLYGLMAIAAFILTIASINFINLSMAQSVLRTKEIGVRKVLGSSRRKIMLQFISETFLLTAIAGALSLFIVNPVLAALQSFIPAPVAINTFTIPTVLFLITITIITTLLAGIYPAKVISAHRLLVFLKGGNAFATVSKRNLWKGLIVFQFTVSLVFIIGTLVVGNQVRYMQEKDMGFEKDGIITIAAVNNERDDNFSSSVKKNVLVDRISQITGIKAVSVSGSTPAAKHHGQTTFTLKDNPAMNIPAQLAFADNEYVSLYDLRLIAGRNLVNSDTMREFLINETCARQLGFNKPADAIGQLVHCGISDGNAPKVCPITGVIADFHSQSMHEPIKPLFMASSHRLSWLVSVKIAGGNTGNVIRGMEKLWKEVYPNEKFEYTFFDETIAKFYDHEKKTSRLMNIAMAIAIFISCMGLFGLASFSANRRTKEIGIRKVLGASVTEIVSMLSGDFLKPVFIAILIASPISYFIMHGWLQDFAYRTDIRWWIFITAAIIAILVAFFTVSFQAIKAAIANPVKSLRTE